MKPNETVQKIMQETGMSLQQAQKVATDLPTQLAKAGFDINQIPKDALLQTIKETYGRVKSGKTAPVPPKPPGFGAQAGVNPAQQAALAQAALANNK